MKQKATETAAVLKSHSDLVSAALYPRHTDVTVFYTFTFILVLMCGLSLTEHRQCVERKI